MTNRVTTIDGFASARSMLAALREGQVSAIELLELHLERIARYNPQLNAIVIPNEERARQRAAEADAAQARGESLGRLHGLPLTIKEWMVPSLAGRLRHHPLCHEVCLRPAKHACMDRTTACVSRKTGCAC